MALIFLVQRILPHEAVEIVGARKYVEHNVQGASRLQRNQQYCQPTGVTEGTEMVMVAFNATNFKRYSRGRSMSRSTFGGRCASASLPWFGPPVFLCAAGVPSLVAGAAVYSVATWN